MTVVDRGFSYHYINEDLSVPKVGDPGNPVTLQHGIDHEPDVAIINIKSGDARLVVDAIDDQEITLSNPSLTTTNVSDLVLEFWHSVPK